MFAEQLARLVEKQAHSFAKAEGLAGELEAALHEKSDRECVKARIAMGLSRKEAERQCRHGPIYGIAFGRLFIEPSKPKAPPKMPPPTNGPPPMGNGGMPPMGMNGD